MKATWHSDACGPAMVSGHAVLVVEDGQTYAVLSRRFLKKVTSCLEYVGSTSPGWIKVGEDFFPWCLPVFDVLRSPVTPEELQSADTEEVEEYAERMYTYEEEAVMNGGDPSFFERQRHAAEAELSRRESCK